MNKTKNSQKLKKNSISVTKKSTLQIIINIDISTALKKEQEAPIVIRIAIPDFFSTQHISNIIFWLQNLSSSEHNLL